MFRTTPLSARSVRDNTAIMLKEEYVYAARPLSSMDRGVEGLGRSDSPLLGLVYLW
jgi:hypothetical protein